MFSMAWLRVLLVVLVTWLNLILLASALLYHGFSSEAQRKVELTTVAARTTLVYISFIYISLHLHFCLCFAQILSREGLKSLYRVYVCHL